MRFAYLALLLGACTAQRGDGDVVGPFTGPTHRYVVDRIDVPTTNTMARQDADDLDGNGMADNQLGMVLATLASQGDITPHGADMIASGAIASTVEIVADDLANDPTVSVLYRGADGEAAVAMGGRFEAGVFVSNRTATTAAPGKAVVHFPGFVDADPAALPLDNVEIDLTSDGHGGFDAVLRGTAKPDQATAVAYKGAMQMIASDPASHMFFMDMIDGTPHDWSITPYEFETNNLIAALLSPDLTIEGKKVLSFGLKLHLSPCADGRCATSPPADTCADRIVDGDETDVDCGGSCGTCAGEETCAAPSDCDSATCLGTNTCAPASCTDGVKDGFETDVDCGSNCGPCAIAQHCFSDRDCPAQHTCGVPCTSGQVCIDSYDTCR